jgi:hypothetical protein
MWERIRARRICACSADFVRARGTRHGSPVARRIITQMPAYLLPARLLPRELLRRLPAGLRGDVRFERVERLEVDFLPAREDREFDELRELELRELDELDLRPLLRLPEPPFLPPPSCLLTVAQARRSASRSDRPRSS